MTSVQTTTTETTEKGQLPDAPLAMPRQVLETPREGSILRLLTPRAFRTGL